MFHPCAQIMHSSNLNLKEDEILVVIPEANVGPLVTQLCKERDSLDSLLSRLSKLREQKQDRCQKMSPSSSSSSSQAAQVPVRQPRPFSFVEKPSKLMEDGTILLCLECGMPGYGKETIRVSIDQEAPNSSKWILRYVCYGII